MVKRLLYCLLFLLLNGTVLTAQGYLNFIENKGQWDATIQFKTEFKGGAIVFQKNGYRVLQHRPEDYQRVTNWMHNHQENKTKKVAETNNNNFNQTPEEADQFKIKSHVYEVNFFNAHPNPEIIPEKIIPGIHNYFIGDDSTKWGRSCKTFQAFTYKNVYPNIDIRYYSSNGALKYDVVVHPGGDPSQVIMHYKGVDQLKVKNKALQIQTPVALHKELIPSTYVIDEEGNKELGCSYYVKGSFVGFNINEPYDKTKTLVIDPSPVYASFSGSVSDNWGFTATYDGSGNMYTGGIIFGGAFPKANGTFQGGEFDMAIMKYDVHTSNSLAYATIIGGSGSDQPHSLIVDKSGNLVIAGRTSSSNYPTKGATKKWGTGGGYDIVMTKLNATGSALIGSIIIGGSANDGVNIEPNYGSKKGPITTRRNYGDDARSEVLLDNNQNILLASVTQSGNFPVKNAFQSTHGSIGNGNNQDGVLIRMSPTLDDVLNCSFIGGNDDDAAFVMGIQPGTGDIFVAGATASTNLDGSKAGVIYPANSGAVDGFIANIKSDFSQINKTTYFGTSGIDVIFGIQFDKYGFPYITGTTTGLFTPINSPFDEKYPAQKNGKHFIAKLSADLSQTIFLTNFGNGDANAARPSLSLTAFMVDRCQNLYVAGWGWGSQFNWETYSFATLAGLPLSDDRFQGKTDEGEFYFLVLSKDSKDILYGTFYGQTGGFADHVDGGTSRFDPSGAIYQTFCSCANRNSSGISKQLKGTAGAWSDSRGNNECNMFSVRFDFDKAGVASGIVSAINGIVNDSVGCIPLKVVFEDTVTTKSKGNKFYWDFDGDGTNDLITTDPTATYTYTTVGDYRVRLVSEDLNTCNERDTSYINIKAQNNTIGNLNFSYAATDCNKREFMFTNLTTLPSSGGVFTNKSFQWDFGDGSPLVIMDNKPVTHTFPAEGTYKVKLTLLDPQFCNQDDYKDSLVFVAQSLIPSFKVDTTCYNTPTQITYTGKGGSAFVWDFGDGTTLSNQINPTHTYSGSGKFTVKLTVTDNNVCDVIKTKTLTGSAVVIPTPIAGLDYTPKNPTPNQVFDFTNSSLLGTKYLWDFGDGKTFSTNNKFATVQHSFPKTGTYNVCLNTSNELGCTVKSCVQVFADVSPVYDVSNAFTPNGDGVNDVIYVRGFGITKMTWHIYNRWGTLVYLGTNMSDGWDGKYNGKLQPQDVYQYTLEVEFSDKSKSIKKGDITLLK